jgi:hypothetical protein
MRYLLLFWVSVWCITAVAQSDEPVFLVKARPVIDTGRAEREVAIYWVGANPANPQANFRPLKDSAMDYMTAWNFKRYHDGGFEYRDSSEAGGSNRPYQSCDVSVVYGSATVNYHSANNLMTAEIKRAFEKFQPGGSIIIFRLHRTSLKGEAKTETYTVRILRLPARFWLKEMFKVRRPASFNKARHQ